MPPRLTCLFSGLLLSFVANTASADPVVLPESPALSPDGKHVVFSYLGDVWMTGIDETKALPLTSHPARDDEPFFSPDGKQIAFTSDRTGSNQIFVMSLDERIPKQVTFHTEGYQNQGWYPDGTTILTLGSRDHYWRDSLRMIQVGVEKRSTEKVLFDAACEYARISPDGKRMLYTREGERWWRKGYVGTQASQIWILDLDTGETEQLLNHPGGCRTPIWKPDGSGFFYVGAETGSFNLREYNFESKETKVLTDFKDDSVVSPTISADGKTIVFRHLFDLYRLRLGAKKPPIKMSLETTGDVTIDSTMRRTLTSADNATFTDDGLEIAFVSGRDLWVMDTTLKEPVQITNTGAEEKEPLFSTDGNAIYFLRDVDGQQDLYKVERKDNKKFWWQNTEFIETQITNDAATDANTQLTPDGKKIAVVKEQGDLWLMDLDGKNAVQLVTGFNAPQYSFSPDGTWVAYSQYDNDFNSEIWIMPTDGSKPAVNVSRHPDNDRDPVWSPDGKILAFVGRRNAEETDIYYVYLRKDDEEETSRDRTLKAAIEKMKKARPQSPANQPATPEKKPDAAAKPADEKKPDDKPKAPEPKLMDIDIDDIHERLHRVSIPESEERGLFWFADGKTLGFSASIKGDSGTHIVQIPSQLSPKKISSSTGYVIKRLKDKKRVAWLAKGKLGTLQPTGSTETFSFSVNQELNQHDRFQAGFNTAWRLMRDNWYDQNLNNRNWDAIRRKYAEPAGKAADIRTMATLVQMMLGELNGSHLGFYPSSSSKRPSGWTPTTVHLGLRFDPEFKGPGLKIRDVILDGPCDKQKVSIEAGAILTAIDGMAVDPDFDLTTVLNGATKRDVTLTIKNAEEKTRDVTIRPTTYSVVRELLYRQWVKQNEKMVAEMSEEKLGYLHIRLMNDSSFREFERQLYNIGYGKDGLVIDVRDNGGGFTTDHLLTALTQPVHAITVPRAGGQGYPQDRKIYASWNKPIVVLCNQNSYSNAEIFSHAIKNLKRGKVVGVTTAGGVISTGGASVMDLGFLRQPFRGWYITRTGEDMELNGAKPHHELWPLPGEIPKGKDRQIEKAVQVLTKDVKKWKKRPQPKLINASELRAESNK